MGNAAQFAGELRDFPQHVVAAALGNAQWENGLRAGGRPGDGGRSTGFMQWNGPRAANFQRVIGVPPAQATAAQSAQFFRHEMMNPQEAGMTMAQRDAIMNAPDAPTAARLIEQYYERPASLSDAGSRAAAAQQFAASMR